MTMVIDYQHFFQEEEYEDWGSLILKNEPLIICDASYEHSAKCVIEASQATSDEVRYERAGIYVQAVREGRYHLGIEYLDKADEEHPTYIKRMTLVHESAQENFSSEGVISVDAGNVGIYPVSQFYNVERLKEIESLEKTPDTFDWIEYVCATMDDYEYIDEFGVTVSSGFGDGLYNVVLYFDAEEFLVGIAIAFIEAEER